MQPDHDRPLPARLVGRIEQVRLEIVAERDLRPPHAFLHDARPRVGVRSGTLEQAREPAVAGTRRRQLAACQPGGTGRLLAERPLDSLAACRRVVRRVEAADRVRRRVDVLARQLPPLVERVAVNPRLDLRLRTASEDGVEEVDEVLDVAGGRLVLPLAQPAARGSARARGTCRRAKPTGTPVRSRADSPPTRRSRNTSSARAARRAPSASSGPPAACPRGRRRISAADGTSATARPPAARCSR